MRHHSITQFPPSIRRVACLLMLLAVALTATGTKPGEKHHVSPLSELSRVASHFVSDVVPHDAAILPQIPLWKVHLPIHRTRIKVFTTTFPFVYQQGPPSRAPPMT